VFVKRLNVTTNNLTVVRYTGTGKRKARCSQKKLRELRYIWEWLCETELWLRTGYVC